MSESAAALFHVERLGLIMQADPAIPAEVEGVLNPAAARGPDGDLYLFPRIVGRGNYSRVGIARVHFNDAGNPAGVERLGYALEPREPYELRAGTGGCEDPRVTYVEPLQRYVMAYTAWGPVGPRIALAVSDDLLSWRRLGLVEFLPDPDPVYGVHFDTYHNKDGAFFPRIVLGPAGQPSLVLMHRPVYTDAGTAPRGIADARPSIWLSYCALEDVLQDVQGLTKMRGHHVLIDPEYAWEALRIGGGPPPLLTPLGWLLVYHGVTGHITPRVAKEQQHVAYVAGVVVLDEQNLRRIVYRSPEPILAPETGEETEGVVPNVVFPTGLDDRGAGRVDMYYGMADLRIGVVRLQIPAELPGDPAGEPAPLAPVSEHQPSGAGYGVPASVP